MSLSSSRPRCCIIPVSCSNSDNRARSSVISSSHLAGPVLFLLPYFLGVPLRFSDFGLTLFKLIPRQLRVRVLHFLGRLLVPPCFARLALQRSDLPFHFPDQVRHSQQILLRIL